MAMSIWRERRPSGIDDEGGRGAVGFGEIAVENFEPVMFGGGSGGGGVLEGAADGELG